MLKCVFLPVFLLTFHFSSYAVNGYRFNIDLLDVKNDKVGVELICPEITEETVHYALPKIVPGTYSIYDFGRFVEGFSASDQDGNPLPVAHDDVNTWTISNANKLAKISYRVNDSFDAYDKDNPIFEPAGSNTQVDTNYLINTFAYTGYFEQKEELPYELNISHPSDFYGSTALTDEDNSNTMDRFSEANYHAVADNPIMYCRPDTSVIHVGNCSVLLSVYSPDKMIHSTYLARIMDTLLQAQGEYLGGKLPVDKYAFIIYLTTKEGISGGSGALEHSYCSVYFMPEFEERQFALLFRDFAAHEFFHILTPLTIHSEEIQYFDFSHPKMSEHLWLYEGTTEYHAYLVQEKYHLITPDDFLGVISDKITTSMFSYNDTLPFTEMSKGCLDQYKNQYANVYQKGALIGMCLDIKLRKLSNGKYGIQDLIHDLGKEYGKDKPFKDPELFTTIGQLTYPAITDFLNTYVSGSQPLPYSEIFDDVGVNYIQKDAEKKFSMGNLSLSANPKTNRNVIVDISNMNEFGKAAGFRENDEIVSINGTEVNADNFAQVRSRWIATVKEGDPFKVVVLRKNEKGKDKKITLKTKVFKASVNKYNLLSFSENPSAEQLKVRNAWLNP